jgi:hypothetical protein
MSLPTVKEILIKAATDPEFRKKLFENPETVLAQYELTIEERQSLKELNEETLAKAMQIKSSEDARYSNDIRI